MGYLTWRGLAIVGAGIVVGLVLLPDYAFFLVVGISAVIGGFLSLAAYPVMGWILLVAGGLMTIYGVKQVFDHMRAEDEEAEKAADEVRRRFRH